MASFAGHPFAATPFAGGTPADTTQFTVVGPFPEFELWDKLEIEGGQPLASFSELREAEIRIDLQGRERLRLVAPRNDSVWDVLESEQIIRTVDRNENVEEWRIRRPRESFEQDGSLLGEVEAEGIRYDLVANTELIERVEDDGTVTGTFDLLQLTPAEHVSFVMDYVPDYFNTGTIDPTDDLNIQYNWDTPLSILDQIAEATDSELEIERQGNGSFNINLLDERGANATTSYMEVGKNILNISHEVNTKDQATRVYPIGSGGREPDVAPGTLAQNAWEVASVSGTTIFFVGDPVGFDGQLDSMGTYVEAVNGTMFEVTGSTAPDQITVGSDASSDVTAGDELTFYRNANKDDLTYLEDPDGVSNQGIKSKKLEFNTVSGIENLVDDPFLKDWSGGLPTQYDLVGSPPIEQSTAQIYTKLGNSSAHIGTNATKVVQDEGIETDIIDVAPTGDRPYFSVAAKLKVISGSVRIEIVDVTNNRILPDPQGEQLAYTSKTGVWTESIAINAIDDFHDAGTTQMRVRVVANEDDTEFYLDAVQLTKNQKAPTTFEQGRSSNILWNKANDELQSSGQPVDRFSLDIFDLERADEDFQFDRLVLGGSVSVTADDIGLDFSTRIIEITRDLLRPGKSNIKISNRPEDLTGLLGSRRLRARLAQDHENGPPIPPDIDPDTIQYTFEDEAVIRWNAVRDVSHYEVRWIVTGSGNGWSDADEQVLGKPKDDKLIVDLDTIVDDIQSRQFDILIKGVSTEGNKSRNAAQATIENPAPTVAPIDEGIDIASSNQDGALRIEIDTDGTESKWVTLYGKGTSGFTKNRSNRVAQQEILDSEVTFQTEIPESVKSDLAPVQDGDQGYFIFEFKDALTDPLNESTADTNEVALVVAGAGGPFRPVWSTDIIYNPGSETATFDFEFKDIDHRSSAIEYQYKLGQDTDFNGTWLSTWDTSTGVPGTDTFFDRAETLNVGDKHLVQLKARLTWTDSDGSQQQTIIGPLTADKNSIAQVVVQDLSFAPDGTPELDLGWDDDTHHVRYEYNVADFNSVLEPSDPDLNSARFPSSGQIDNGQLSLNTTLSSGEAIWIKLAGVTASDKVASGKYIAEVKKGVNLAQVEPDWKVVTDQTGDQGEMAVFMVDFQGRASGAAFDKAPLDGGDWNPADPPDNTWDQIDTVATAGQTGTLDSDHGPFPIGDKHPRRCKAALRWRDDDGVDHWSVKEVTFDINVIPEVHNLGVYTTPAGNVRTNGNRDADGVEVFFTVTTDGSTPTDPENTTPDASTQNASWQGFDTGVNAALEDEVQMKAQAQDADGNWGPVRYTNESLSPSAPETTIDVTDPTDGDNAVDVTINAEPGIGGDAASLEVEYQVWDGSWGSTQGWFAEPHSISDFNIPDGDIVLMRARARDTSLGNLTGIWAIHTFSFELPINENLADFPQNSKLPPGTNGPNDEGISRDQVVQGSAPNDGDYTAGTVVFEI